MRKPVLPIYFLTASYVLTPTSRELFGIKLIRLCTLIFSFGYILLIYKTYLLLAMENNPYVSSQSFIFKCERWQWEVQMRGSFINGLRRMVYTCECQLFDVLYLLFLFLSPSACFNFCEKRQREPSTALPACV